MFHKTSRGEKEVVICEDCYRESCYGQDDLVKAYKHCILEEVITPGASRNICRCSTVPHFDSNGRSRTLFPINKEDNHRNIEGGVQCGLLKLKELVAEAKYDGMQTTIKKRISLSEEKRLHEKEQEKKRDARAKIEAKEAAKIASRGRKMKIVTNSSLQNASLKIPTSGTASIAEEQEAGEDIPFFLRKYTERYPFGNVHIALRVGPLIIENGVSQ
jgi:hypothetical protein